MLGSRGCLGAHHPVHDDGRLALREHLALHHGDPFPDRQLTRHGPLALDDGHLLDGSTRVLHDDGSRTGTSLGISGPLDIGATITAHHCPAAGAVLVAGALDVGAACAAHAPGPGPGGP